MSRLNCVNYWHNVCKMVHHWVFLAKESKSHYDEYWSAVTKDIQKHKTFLWAALQSGEIVGTVQLVRATKANALHRA